MVTDEPYIVKVNQITGFNDPAGVNVHPDGNLYVADYHNDQVKVYDDALNLIQTLGSTRGSAPGQFSEPWDIAFDREGRALITDTNNARVQVFTASGTLEYTFPTGNSHQDVAINPDNYVYVSGRQPEVYETDGIFLGAIPLDQNYYPRSIALDGGNRVIFSNWGNQNGCCTYDENNFLTIQTPQGQFLQKIDLDYQPHFVDVDRDNRIWVADHTNNRVHVYASDGSLIKTFDLGAGLTTEDPSGLEIEGSMLYLTSHVSDRVDIYEITNIAPSNS